MTPSVIVQVPDIEHPTLCYQQQVVNHVIVNFARCVKLKGHDGPHTWEQVEGGTVRTAVKAVVVVAAWLTLSGIASAQAITSWTLSTYTVTSIGPPLVLSAAPVVPPTVIPLASATCNQTPPATTSNVNPTRADWTDPVNAGKICFWVDPGTGSIAGAPISSTVTYASIITATNSAGTSPASTPALFTRPGVAPVAPTGLVLTQ